MVYVCFLAHLKVRTGDLFWVSDRVFRMGNEKLEGTVFGNVRMNAYLCSLKFTLSGFFCKCLILSCHFWRDEVRPGSNAN